MAPWVSHTALTGARGWGVSGSPTQNYGVTGCFGLEGILKLTDLRQFRTAWISHVFSGRWEQGEVQLLGTGEVEQEREA